MQILIVVSEALPYIKTGGLADVSGSLPVQLARAGHSVLLVIPYYKSIRFKGKEPRKVVYTLRVPMGDTSIACACWEVGESDKLRVCLIENDFYFDRTPIYDNGSEAYEDNGARFAFFSKASLDLSIQIGFRPDIVLCNDWQTALIPYYIKCWDWGNGFFDDTASILAIHNLGYQGHTNRSYSRFIGLNWMQMREEEFEEGGSINLLKGGIFYADKLITVSPTYAAEILSEPGGHGLSEFLVRRREDLVGIVNGIDTNEWNPKTDVYLPENYDTEDLGGKKTCKMELQRQFLLRMKSDIPIFGFVGRLASQKGLDVLRSCIDRILAWELQLVFLGSGDSNFAHYFGELPKYRFGKVGSYIGYDAEKAHLIEAGSDFFLMPSQYEPCGLNQIYSMIYGTLPIVRATGGLNDTVRNYDPEKGNGTGFLFSDMTPEALVNTIGWALDTWYNRKEDYRKMQRRAMRQDFSWDRPIREYEKTFEQAISRRRTWH